MQADTGEEREKLRGKRLLKGFQAHLGFGPTRGPGQTEAEVQGPPRRWGVVSAEGSQLQLLKDYGPGARATHKQVAPSRAGHPAQICRVGVTFYSPPPSGRK